MATYTKLPPVSTGGGSTSDEVTNLSSVPGANLTDALNNVDNTIVEVQYKPSTPIELSLTDVSNRYILLAEVPTNPDKTIIYIIGGSTQEYGVDFEYLDTAPVGPRISWNGLGLDGRLEAGDKLIIVSQ